MSPAPRRNFEHRIGRAIAAWLSESDLGLRVESVNLIGCLEGPEGRTFLLKFRFQDRWATRTGFTFPFDERLPDQQNLAAAKSVLKRLAPRLPAMDLPSPPVAAQPVRQ